MDKETSSRVSTIAGQVMNLEPAVEGASVSVTEYNALLDLAQTLAGSCMSQDQTPGQAAPKGDFLSRLKDEREDLERRLIALNSYLSNNPGKPNPRHNAMLNEQSKLMSDLLAVIDERLCDLEISNRWADPEKIDGE